MREHTCKPRHSKEDYARLKKEIVEDYKKMPRPYEHLAWQYNLHRSTVGEWLRAAGVAMGNVGPWDGGTPVSFLSVYINNWGRPREMAKYVEKLDGQRKERYQRCLLCSAGDCGHRAVHNFSSGDVR